MPAYPSWTRYGAPRPRRGIGSEPAATGAGYAAGSALADVAVALAAHGYEPRRQHNVLVLANCPFHALARDHTALVCGMNLHLITALLDELGHAGVRATLQPAPGRCCVTLREDPADR